MLINFNEQSSKQNFGMAIKMTENAHKYLINNVNSTNALKRINDVVNMQKNNPVDSFYKIIGNERNPEILGHINDVPYSRRTSESIPHYFERLSKLANKKSKDAKKISETNTLELQKSIVKNTRESEKLSFTYYWDKLMKTITNNS